MPDRREALDWLTLVRVLGWDVDLLYVNEIGRLETALPESTRIIIVACDPESLSEEAVAVVSATIESERMLVVSRGARTGSALAKIAGTCSDSDRLETQTLDWRGPGGRRTILFKNPFASRRLSVERREIWATAGETPIVTARTCGRSVVATLGFHPSELRDADHAGTAVIRNLLTWGSPGPVAWLDFEHTLVLRMDDPGGAQNVYSRTWSYPKLNAAAWGEVGADLAARGGRMSLAYVSGWVDDADESRGHVTIGGQPVTRHAGEIYPSPLVRYEDVAGHAPGTIHDYDSEFRGIQELRRLGLADVELHGYTHMHPDTKAWSRAPDRFESAPSTAWFRELGRAAASTLEARSPRDHPLAHALDLFRTHFDVMPTTLISPGDQWTDAALERALELGLQLVDSYYLAIRHQDRFCWAQHICAPYLNRAEPAWFASGLPVVGYFHDYDLAVEGVRWMIQWLDRWQEMGARRFIDFRELASALACRLTLDEAGGRLLLTVGREPGPPLVRPVPVRLKAAEALPSHLTVLLNGRPVDVEIDQAGDGTGVALLPAAS